MAEIIVKLTGDHIKVKGGEYVQDLVRCKECKYYLGLAECEIVTECMGTDGFCSYGERKESE